MKRTNSAGAVRIACLSLASLLVLSGCGGGEGGGRETDPDASAVPEEKSAPPVELPGIVVYHDDQTEPFLTVHDPGSGEQKAQISLADLVPDRMPDYGNAKLFAFSPDLRYAAFSLDGKVRFGELKAGEFAYSETAVLEPEEGGSFSGGEITLQYPMFSSDGSKLFMVEQVEKSEEPMRVLSVETGAAGDSGFEEAGEVPAESFPTDWTGTESGEEGYFQIGPDDRIRSGEVVEAPANGAWEKNSKGYYRTAEGVEPVESLLDESGRHYGLVDLGSWGEAEVPNGLYAFDLSEDGLMENEVQLVASEPGQISDFWLDEEGGRIIIEADGGFFEVPVDSTSPVEPELLFSEFTFEGPDADELEAIDRVLGPF